MTDFQIALSTGIFILAFINLVIVLIEKNQQKIKIHPSNFVSK